MQSLFYPFGYDAYSGLMASLNQVKPKSKLSQRKRRKYARQNPHSKYAR